MRLALGHGPISVGGRLFDPGQTYRPYTRDQAYFLCLYNPIQLYAVNKAVAIVPYVNILNLAETAVTERHWSVRKQKAAG